MTMGLPRVKPAVLSTVMVVAPALGVAALQGVRAVAGRVGEVKRRVGALDAGVASVDHAVAVASATRCRSQQ